MIKLSKLDIEYMALVGACFIRLLHLFRLYFWDVCYLDKSFISIIAIDCLVAIIEFLTRPTYNEVAKIYAFLFLLSLPALFIKDC